ncbi:hypothetical protein [Duncaniella muris]|uniref:hypothetical protein n=1 Tax=Duncaniella muris TaxID=2094150 RepID=UPI00105739DC|nr:hypothetical protein [Duncaniella muris]
MLNLLFCKNNLFLPFFQGFLGDFCRFSKVILLVFAVFPRFFGRFLPFSRISGAGRSGGGVDKGAVMARFFAHGSALWRNTRYGRVCLEGRAFNDLSLVTCGSS